MVVVPSFVACYAWANRRRRCIVFDLVVTSMQVHLVLPLLYELATEDCDETHYTFRPPRRRKGNGFTQFYDYHACEDAAFLPWWAWHNVRLKMEWRDCTNVGRSVMCLTAQCASCDDFAYCTACAACRGITVPHYFVLGILKWADSGHSQIAVNASPNTETMTFKQVTSHQYLLRTNVPSMQRHTITFFTTVGHYFIP